MRNDFFVRHLLGVSPPDWNAGASLTADSSQERGELEFPDLDEVAPSFFDYSDDFRGWARS